MKKKDKRIDVYIEKGQPFAKPFCSFASFKEHAVFGFWKYQLIKDPKGYLQDIRNKGGEAMGNLGRIRSLKDLPPDKVMIDFIKQVKKLNDERIKLPQKTKKPQPELVIPKFFIDKLKKNKTAFEAFNSFSYSHKKEYVEWITEAKTEATRDKRIATAIEWMIEGRSRNWKYMK